MKSKVLLVKNFPSTLSKSEKTSLLKCFGANDVRVMSDNGKLKNSAFCTFPNETKASESLIRLHQLNLLDSVLSVEYAQGIPNLADCTSLLKPHNETKPQEKSKSVTVSGNSQSCHCNRKLLTLSTKLGLEYNVNPRCKYRYPDPNPDILLNICAALLAVPKFYTQVLHLMNKMNLYAPFTPATFIPPMLLSHLRMILNLSSQHPDSNNAHFNTSTDQDINQDHHLSESEMESDEPSHNFNILPPKRATRIMKRRRKNLSNSPKRKLARLKETVVANQAFDSKEPHKKANLATVFEEVNPDSLKRHINVHMPSSIAAQHQSALENESKNENELNLKESLKIASPVDSGFGKIVPLEKPINIIESDNTTDYVITKNFITEKQLQEGKLSAKDLASHSLFRNFSPGQPSCRLYVKNLPKKSTEKDMQHIFGRFVNFENEEEAKMFDVRVMTQGRMKGQAFIGLPSVECAIKAVNLVNGYQLMGKPIVVMFARSAKPKNI